MLTFYESIKDKFNPVSMDSASDIELYIRDYNHTTEMTSGDSHLSESLRIVNNNLRIIRHICVDGGLIEWGKENYIPNDTRKKVGRPDCIIGYDGAVMYVELKMDTLPQNIISRTIKGIQQISDFVEYIKSMPEAIFPTKQKAIIGVKHKHNPSKGGITNLNNEKELFRKKFNFLVEICVQNLIIP